jgi:glycosyltransferase involved in cell wall biosynthesis
MMPTPPDLRVCFVMSIHRDVIMGGAQYQAHLLAEECAGRKGVSVTYLGRNMPQGESAGRLPYHVIKAGSAAGIRSRALLFDAYAVWRALSRIRPHVIYQRMKQSYTGVCALYARTHDVPMFFHVASAADVSRRLMGKRLSMSSPFDLAESFAGNWGMRHASHILVQSQSQARLLQENFKRQPARVVGNFQPLPPQLPQKFGDKTRVLWVGNIKDVKRPELFVDLARSLRERRDIEFWMVGLPSKQKRFQPMMTAIGSCENLRYFGQLSLADVNALMCQADVFVNTSRYEGFPNTFIQAWANGAVVVSLVVDIDNGLESQGVGFCSGDVERLRAVIVDLAHSRPQRQAIAARAFDYVHQMHSTENAAQLVDFMLQEAAVAASRA